MAKIKKPNAAKHCQTLPVPGTVIQLAEGHKGGVPTRGAGLGIPNLHPCSRDKVPEIVGKSSRSRNEHRHSYSFLFSGVRKFFRILINQLFDSPSLKFCYYYIYLRLLLSFIMTLSANEKTWSPTSLWRPGCPHSSTACSSHTCPSCRVYWGRDEYLARMTSTEITWGR